MHLFRRHRAWIARIVCCTLLLALLTPALRHPAAAPAAVMEICTAAGVRLVHADDAPAAPKKLPGQHCLACYVHQAAILPDLALPPTAPAPPVAHVIRAASSAVATAPPEGAAWPRAPPRNAL